MTAPAALASTGVLHAGGPAVWVALAACVGALGPSGIRWLRVAQREHYLGGSVPRFALRWWTVGWPNLVLGAVGLAGLVASVWWPLAALATAAAVAGGPLGLSLRGRTSQLAWTRRLRTLAAVWVVLQALIVVVGVIVGLPAVVAAAGTLAVPLVMDLACRVMAPVERRLVQPYVRSAAKRLEAVHPTVVAITGSYGKTSTKRHVADLVAGTRTVVATPASFNNRAGLARAVNEHLAEGTEVFVAEMGVYGPGEIAEMSRWCRPDVAVITAIGPVHLERMGTEEQILEAKAEITELAHTVVLNVDDHRLAGLADRLDGVNPAKEVVRCSALDSDADVAVEKADDGRLTLYVGGSPAGPPVPAPLGLQPSNLACAAAVALRLGVPATDVAQRLGRLAPAPNRLAAGTAASGVLVIDDTFNSNPVGARAALEVLAGTGALRRAVVTPGMVELGRRQAEENRDWAAAASRAATDLVIVGQTNRRALIAGSAGLVPVLVPDRAAAVDWVRSELGPGDAVLYENDLPDHYP